MKEYKNQILLLVTLLCLSVGAYFVYTLNNTEENTPESGDTYTALDSTIDVTSNLGYDFQYSQLGNKSNVVTYGRSSFYAILLSVEAIEQENGYIYISNYQTFDLYPHIGGGVYKEKVKDWQKLMIELSLVSSDNFYTDDVYNLYIFRRT